MTHTAAESLFHLATAMRAVYPRRSSYDRGSALTVDLAVANGEWRRRSAAGRRRTAIQSGNPERIEAD